MKSEVEWLQRFIRIMDLINGISMYDRLAVVGKDIVMSEMMTWFEKIHQVKGLNLHSVSEYLIDKIE